MAIFLTKDSKVIVQGMTGATGMKHTKLMLADGTNIVGGVNPRKAGTSVDFDGTEVPVFGSVAEAIEKTGANVSVLFVPPAFSKAAVVEAIDAEIPLAVVITEGIAVHDSAAFWAYANEKGNKTRIIGPNCPGLITPGQSNAGIIPGDITKPGRIGLVSKSGTLTYQMMYELRDIGFSSAVGIGGDPVIGTTHIDALAAFEADPDTDLIVMIGEIGGDAEERAADFIAKNVTKPVVGYVAGFTAPEGKTMGRMRRHRLRLLGHRPGEEGGPGGHAASRSARRRPRPPSWRARSSAPDAGRADARTRTNGAGPHPLFAQGCGPAPFPSPVRRCHRGCGTSRSGPCASCSLSDFCSFRSCAVSFCGPPRGGTPPTRSAGEIGGS